MMSTEGYSRVSAHSEPWCVHSERRNAPGSVRGGLDILARWQFWAILGNFGQKNILLYILYIYYIEKYPLNKNPKSGSSGRVTMAMTGRGQPPLT